MPGMLKTCVALCWFLCVGVGACKKHPPAKPAAPAISPMTQRSNPSSARLPPLTPAEVRALLTEDKISRFAIYQMERMRTIDDVAPPTPATAPKGQTAAPKPQDPTAAGERRANPAAARQAALAKSGLSEEEAAKLNQLLRAYYTSLFHMQLAIKRDEESRTAREAANAKSRKPGADDHGLSNLRRDQEKLIAAMRREFAARYGDDALKLVQKHEPEFATINERKFGGGIHPPMR
jgi:hypothetical protein